MVVNIDFTNLKINFDVSFLLEIKLTEIGSNSKFIFNDIVNLVEKKVKIECNEKYDRNKQYKITMKIIQKGKQALKHQYYFNLNFSDFYRIDNLVISHNDLSEDNYKKLKSITLNTKLEENFSKDVFVESHPTVISRSESSEIFSIYKGSSFMFIGGHLSQIWGGIGTGIYLDALLGKTDDIQEVLRRINLLLSKGVLIAYVK